MIAGHERPLYCGVHDGFCRFFCAEHREYDHCGVRGWSPRDEAEQRSAEARTLDWVEAWAKIRRRYVCPGG